MLSSTERLGHKICVPAPKNQDCRALVFLSGGWGYRCGANRPDALNAAFWTIAWLSGCKIELRRVMSHLRHSGSFGVGRILDAPHRFNAFCTPWLLTVRTAMVWPVCGSWVTGFAGREVTELVFWMDLGWIDENSYQKSTQFFTLPGIWACKLGRYSLS